MSDVILYEHKDDEEYYAQFIKIVSEDSDQAVLVFNYEPADRELAERIAALMGDSWRWAGLDESD